MSGTESKGALAQHGERVAEVLRTTRFAVSLLASAIYARAIEGCRAGFALLPKSFTRRLVPQDFLRASAVLLVTYSLFFAANGFVRRRGAITRADRESSSYDAIVVLGAGVWAHDRLSWVLEDRLQTAVEAYREGLAPRILVSGDHGREGYDELGPSRNFLVAAGVPDEAIFLDHAGLDTYSTFWRARRVFGVESALVSTQQFHMERALYFARSEGIRADAALADRRSYGSVAWLRFRENFSRTVGLLYVTFGRKPRRPAGATIDLRGSGHVTHDPHE
jgi:vancomycin permeability regulator SanA